MKLITNKKFQIVLAVLVIAIVNLYDLSSQYAITIINDEFGYVGLGAQMAGYDWTSTLGTSAYYSYGFGIVLSLLFRLGLTGVSFYRAVIVLNVLLLIASFFITCFFTQKLFASKWDVLIALAVNLYSCNIFQSKLNWAETILYFLTWLLLLLIYQLNEKYELKYLLGIVVVSVYMYIVHQRCLSVIIASTMLVILILLNKNFDKKNIGKLLVAFAVMAGFLLITSYVKDYIIANWYVAESADVGRIAVNDYSAQTEKIAKLTSVRYVAYLILGMIGKLWAQSTASGLLILFSLIAALSLVWQKITDIIKKKAVFRLDDKQVFLVSAALLFLGSLGVASIYKLRGLSDQRYYEIVMTRYIDYVTGPMLLFGLYILYHYRKYFKEIVFSVIVMIGMTVLTYFQFVRTYQPVMITLNIASVYPFIKNVSNDLKTILVAGAGVIGFMGLLLAAMRMGMRKNKQDITFGIVVAVTACIFAYNGVTLAEGYTGYKQQEVVDYVMPIVDYMEENDWEGTVYYLKAKSNDSYNFLKILQFMRPELKIELINKENLPELIQKQQGDLLLVATKSMEEFDLTSIEEDFVMDTGRLCVYTVEN